jgi:SAM-dependent methyltransferase
MSARSRVPRPLKVAGRSLLWRGVDTFNSWRGHLVPPRRLRNRVPGDFEAVGREFLRHFIWLGGLRTDQSVLDIGCGAGRFAIPLTSYLEPSASYVGVDCWEEGIDWCRREITSRFSSFQCLNVKGLDTGVEDDVIAEHRRPVIPFEDGSFDFATVCAISQLDLLGLQTRLMEAGRLLRPSGVYVGTWFLLDENDDAGDRHALACHEPEMHARLADAGLTVQEIHYGSWNGREEPLSYQDLVVARRSQ